MNLTWIKLTTGDWCPFESVDISNVTTFGVYVIWHGAPNPWTVRVGQGFVRDRILAHRNDATITAYKQLGKLYVTWAAVPASQRDGVERYLADRLRPLIGERHPDVGPIVVNLPWD